ncbi:single-stranded DNA-binding protein [Thermobispora bispora]|jgi:single-strand DNA-binding protein|nr:single-stranded DNA-binding protein [Actinomycetales bacterium]QSI48935.1 single-stranded DNA-binding protein [Thermobispora bispora]
MFMSDVYVTLSGNVTDEPRQYRFSDGSRVTSIRVAVNRRVLDPQTNTWQTKDTTFYTVRCYRGLADHVHQSIRKGQPVLVYGKLRIKQFERDGEPRFWAEVEASSVGHDLKWGIATFEKPARALAPAEPNDEERRAMEDATREWELIDGRGSRAPGTGAEDGPDPGRSAGPAAGAAGEADIGGAEDAEPMAA